MDSSPKTSVNGSSKNNSMTNAFNDEEEELVSDGKATKTERVTRSSEERRKKEVSKESFERTVERVKDLQTEMKERLNEWAVNTKRTKGEKKDLDAMTDRHREKVDEEMMRISDVFHHLTMDWERLVRSRTKNDVGTEMEDGKIIDRNDTVWDEVLTEIGANSVHDVVDMFKELKRELNRGDSLIGDLKRAWDTDDLEQLFQMPMLAPEVGLLTQRAEAAEKKLKEVEKESRREIRDLKRRLTGMSAEDEGGINNLMQSSRPSVYSPSSLSPMLMEVNQRNTKGEDSGETGRDETESSSESEGSAKGDDSSESENSEDSESGRSKRDSRKRKRKREKKKKKKSPPSECKEKKRKRKERRRKEKDRKELIKELPPLEKYDGKREGWALFSKGFKVRYAGRDEELVKMILSESLVDKAKMEYKALPKSVEKEGWEKCLKWLKERVYGGTMYTVVDFERKLRRQVLGNKRVSDVCEDFTRWIDGMYEGEALVDVREQMKKKQLLILFEKTRDYARLLEMLDSNSTYEEMKQFVERMEYVRRIERSDQMAGRTSNTVGRCGNCGESGHRSMQCTKPRKDITAIRCYNCNQIGHRSYTCTKTTGERKESDEKGGRAPTNSYKFPHNDSGWNKNGPSVERAGYGARYQSTDRWPRAAATSFVPRQNETRATGGNAQPINPSVTPKWTPARPQTRSNAVQLIGGENSEEVRPSDGEKGDQSLFIKLIVPQKCTIGGVEMEVILDTGSEISLIDMATWQAMRDVPLNRREIRGSMDAQGNEIRVIGTCIANTILENGRHARVGYHVAAHTTPNALLGGPALASLGYQLMSIDGGDKDAEPIQNTSTRDSLRVNAMAMRKTEIEPGEFGMVLVSGISDKVTRMLETERDDVIEGIRQGEGMIRVPVWNGTDTVKVISKYESLGEWKTVEEDSEKLDKVEEKRRRVHNLMMHKDNNDIPTWEEVKSVLEGNREAKIDGSLERVLQRFPELFMGSESNVIGKVKGVECKIELNENTSPIRQKTRPIPFAVREPLRKLVDKMEAQKVIRKSDSPWMSPIVLVRKKDGSIRFCVDYRKVNEVIKQDSYPLPHLESLMQNLEGKKHFTLVDLQAGFWQISMEENSKPITAFSVLDELYEFECMPFGLSIAPSTFQRMMNEVLKEEMKGAGKSRKVLVYMDDLMIATETEEEHIEVLERVLTRLKNNGITLNAKKSLFMVKEVKYLGHILTGEGIHMDADKIEAIRKFERPDTITKLRRFMGMASFYRRFIKGFATIVHPLCELTKGDWNGKKLEWNEKAEAAFNEIKERMMTVPILKQPDMEGAMSGEFPYILMTDASGVGIGAVISQKDRVDGKEKAIAYFSRSLKKCERNYSVIDLEALGIFEAVRKWKYLLYGSRAIVKTDHEPLKTMMKRRNVSPRIWRWAVELQPYNLEIEYVKGRANVVADSLSRSPLPLLNDEFNQDDEDYGQDLVINAVTRSATKDVRMENERIEREERMERTKREQKEKWKDRLSKDDTARMLIERVKDVEKGERDAAEEVRVGTSDCFTLADWKMDDGLLYLLAKDGARLLYIPESERESLIKRVHENPLTGHISGTRLLKQLQREAWWPRMEKDVPAIVKKCEKCFTSNPAKKMIPELVPVVAREPMEIVGVDLVDMGRSSKGNRYILTVVDHFTKYGGAYELKDKSAETVVDTFMKRWVLEGGRVPKTLMSDNGGEFVNSIMEGIAKRWMIDRRLTLPYHSRANGLTERFNRSVIEIIRRLVGRGEEWDDALAYAVYAYNISPHSCTGESPHFMIYGRDEKLPGSDIPQDIDHANSDQDEYKEKMRRIMDRTLHVVNERLEKERDKMKRLYDERHRGNRGKEPVIGDRVFVRRELSNDEKFPKLALRWEGPYRVIKRSATTATIVAVNPQLNAKERVVQIDRLRCVPKGIDEIGIVNQMINVDSVTCREKTLLSHSNCLHPLTTCNCIQPIAKDWKSDLKTSLGLVKIERLSDLARIMEVEQLPDASTLSPAELIRKYKGLTPMDISSATWQKVYHHLCECRLEELHDLDLSKRLIIEDMSSEATTGINNALIGLEDGKNETTIFIPDGFPLKVRSEEELNGYKVVQVTSTDYISKLIAHINACKSNMLIVLSEEITIDEFRRLKMEYVPSGKLSVFSLNPSKVLNDEGAEKKRNLINLLIIWKFETGGELQIATNTERMVGNYIPYNLLGYTDWTKNWSRHFEAVEMVMGVKNEITYDKPTCRKRISHDSQDKSQKKTGRYVALPKGPQSNRPIGVCWVCRRAGHIAKDCTNQTQ